ncbi:hypothetical protein BDV98DRAFT_570485 [Pterulicium gracile]|uniref:Uncharacterized protein n=1 Tax=Pterulicium gracile TaxID=1884261 RepID=A0A5C3QNE8_9AGAR|nr:hypothetical protein BDV98DRAFT_570485 [Pterula gracilis]
MLLGRACGSKRRYRCFVVLSSSMLTIVLIAFLPLCTVSLAPTISASVCSLIFFLFLCYPRSLLVSILLRLLCRLPLPVSCLTSCS